MSDETQMAHAAEIRERTMQRREDQKATPMEKIMQSVRGLIDRVIANEFARVNITGTNCTVSGKFPTLNITVPDEKKTAKAKAADGISQLQIYKIDETTIGISPGQISGITVDGTQTWTVAGNGEIWADATVNSNDAVTGVSIAAGSAGSPSTTHAYLQLGFYVTSNGVLTVTPTVGGSQSLGVCRTYPDNYVVSGWSLI